jgi:CNT family concentrative nucleoside transporter
MGNVKLEVKSHYINPWLMLISTWCCKYGFKIAMNVIAMLIGFIALIALINWMLGHLYHGLSLDFLFWKAFLSICLGYGSAWIKTSGMQLPDWGKN